MCDLLRDIIIIPIEIAAEFFLAKTAVLPIVTLKPGKVTFQTVS